MTRVIADRYRVDDHLALISSSDFYNGFDLKTQQRVIVRLIDIDQEQQKSLWNIQRHMEADLRLVKNVLLPYILQILDSGWEEMTYYQINEFINFKTLQAEITQNPCDLQTALHYGHDLAAFLARLHATGVIHRSIQPDNILITKDGFKLIDFCVARHAVPKHMPIYTTYMSPEAIQEGWDISAAWDVWSFGILLYELLTGSVPYPMPIEQDGQESKVMLVMKILKEPVPPFEDAVPNLPPRLVTLIHGMLETDSAKRISDMNNVAQELDAILSEFSLS